MNRKKIYKILSSTISGLYIANTMSVFAQENLQGIPEEFNNSEIVGNINTDDIENKEDENKEITEDKAEDELEDAYLEKEDDNSGDISDLDSNVPSDESNTTINEDKVEENTTSVDEDVNVNNESSTTNSDEINSNKNEVTDNHINSSIESKIVINGPVPYKPTIDYVDGKVVLKDNGAILEGSTTIEDFDNPQSLDLRFSNTYWTIENGIMKSNKTTYSGTTSNSTTINLSQPAKLSVRVRVSCSDWGAKGVIKVNGNEIFSQKGNNDKFTVVTYDLSPGYNTISFEYVKTSSYDSYESAMFIDKVMIETSAKTLECDSLEYRIDGGDWLTYTEPFSCEEGSLIETRGYHDSRYSDIETVQLNTANIKDDNLRKELNELLIKDLDNHLFLKSELELFTTLDLSNKEISDLSGLECAINLTDLNLNDNNISDLTALETMTKLSNLSAANNNIEDLEPLSKLVNLVSIDFTNNSIANIAPISKLLNLNTIKFKNNNITDKSAINIASNISSLKEAHFNLNFPDLVLNIGEGNLFSNIENLYLDGSNFAEVKINKANKLLVFSVMDCKIGNFSASNCTAMSSIFLNRSTVNDIFVNNISSNSYFGFSMSDGTANNIEILNCANVSYIATQNTVMNSLILDNISSSVGYYISFNLDNMSCNILKISNVLNKCYLNSSHVNSEDVTFKNVYFSSMNMNYSIFNAMKLEEGVEIEYMYLSYFETKSDLDLTNSTIRSFSSNYMKAKSIKFDSCPNLDYAALNFLVAESLIIDNCPQLTGAYPSDAKIKNVYINNLPKVTTISVAALTSENCIIENCPKLTTLTNIYNTNKGNIKNLTIRNLGSATEIVFPKYDIENISISDCNNVSKIDLRENNIKDLSQIKFLNSLANIDVSNNAITDISPLKSITSLNSNNIEALNQNLKLNDVIIKEGTVEIDVPKVIDYDGSELDIKQISDKTKTGTNKVNLGELSEGIHDKVVEFESKIYKYSVNASQKIIVDGTAPEINITPDVDYYTNESVFLDIEAKDTLSGVDYIKLPNGDIVKGSTYTFEAKGNGEYEFEAVDMVGNSIKKSITISNIDREKPVIKTSIIYNTNKTEAIIKIEATDNLSGILSMTLPDETIVEEENASFMVKKNGKYSFEVRDVAGNVYTETIDISELINSSNNDSHNNAGVNDGIPNTGGVLPIITTLSIASILGGLFAIKRKRK